MTGTEQSQKKKRATRATYDKYDRRERRDVIREGMRDAVPIAMVYLAVGFTLGIAFSNAKITAFQAVLASMLNNASAGEYAGIIVIASAAGFLQMAIVTLITNARYMLMSFALNQRMDSDLPLRHRLLVGFGVTDEIFAVTIARSGRLNPYYCYGAMITAMPAWSIGTFLGVEAGNILPLRIVSALSVALYGMFVGIIIPPSRKDKMVGILVILSFVGSYLLSRWPVTESLSAGTKTIILTVAISASGAIIRPVRSQAGDIGSIREKSDTGENKAINDKIKINDKTEKEPPKNNKKEDIIKEG